MSISSLAETVPAPSQDTAPKWPYGRTLVVAPFAGVNLSIAPSYIANTNVGALFGVSAGYFLSERFGLWLAVHLNPRRFSSVGGSTSNSALFVEIPVGVAYRNEGDLFSKTSVNLLKLGISVAIPTGNYTGNMTTTVSMVSRPYVSFAMEASTLYPLSDSVAIGPILVMKLHLTRPVDAESPNLRSIDYNWFSR